MTVYFTRNTGEFVAISDEYVHLLDNEETFENRPEWEQKIIRTTEEFLAHENDVDYVSLPSRYDIYEFTIMIIFATQSITRK